MRLNHIQNIVLKSSYHLSICIISNRNIRIVNRKILTFMLATYHLYQGRLVGAKDGQGKKMLGV
jgi:hypothetical protein